MQIADAKRVFHVPRLKVRVEDIELSGVYLKVLYKFVDPCSIVEK